MQDKTKDLLSDARNIVADLLRENSEIRDLLRYAYEAMEGFIAYKKRTFSPPGVEYSERYSRIKKLVGADRSNQI